MTQTWQDTHLYLIITQAYRQDYDIYKMWFLQLTLDGGSFLESAIRSSMVYGGWSIVQDYANGVVRGSETLPPSQCLPPVLPPAPPHSLVAGAITLTLSSGWRGTAVFSSCCIGGRWLGGGDALHAAVVDLHAAVPDSGQPEQGVVGIAHIWPVGALYIPLPPPYICSCLLMIKCKYIPCSRRRFPPWSFLVQPFQNP